MDEVRNRLSAKVTKIIVAEFLILVFFSFCMSSTFLILYDEFSQPALLKLTDFLTQSHKTFSTIKV